MKKIILYFALLFTSIQLNAQTVTINETGGWLESAFVKWAPVVGADSYNVYYSGGGLTNVKIDTPLIRSYGTYFRADIPGLAAGAYTVTIKPVTAGAEGAGTTTTNITVLAHDRNGFAFQDGTTIGGRVPGGYKVDGTPKTGAVILYITQNTKNTISMNITGASTNPCVGLQNILYAIKKGKDNRAFIIRLIGNITDMTVMDGGDITIENANNASNYITFEGIGSDAVANGWGVRLKYATNVEVRNLGFMNCDSTAGDDVGMQQVNDHIWVHNCDLYYGAAGSAADQVKGDGALDNKGSTYCTYSYNHFWDNGKCSLLGLSENTTTGLYVSYHNNWFDHSDSRHPRVRFYSAHVYNNYFDGNDKYGSGSTMGSSLFVEGNYFRDCKHPMMTSMQGTDVWDEANQKNNAGTMGTFSGEAGGTIKAYNNFFDASNGANNMRFVAYGDTNPLYNIPGKISSTIDFDAYVVANRGDQVPTTVKSFLGANMHNNFDTDPAFYVKNLVVDTPIVARDKTIAYAGRVSGGDLKFTFNNNIDDASSEVNTTIKTALTNYTTTMVAVQGEVNAIVSSQTLATITDNNQTVVSGTPITDMIFTWGGTATDATVTGLTASGITIAKDALAKTITISGTPIANVSFSIATTGTGTVATATGTIIVTLPGNQTLTSTTNSDQTIFSGVAITPIVYTWGGDATDATVTGLPAGLSITKNTIAKTIILSGTPSASGYYSVQTSGTGGIPATGAGTITVLSNSDQIHNFTLSGINSTFYTFVGNLSTSKGTVTYGALTLTQCLKIENGAGTTINYTTAQPSTLTLVFVEAAAKIKIDGTSNTAVNGIITITLAAGPHTLIYSTGTSSLYYMKTSYQSLGLDQKETAPKFILYPNPVSDLLYLPSTDQKIENVMIYSMTGALVKTVLNSTEAIDVSNLNSGNYLVKITSDNGSYTQKILKK